MIGTQENLFRHLLNTPLIWANSPVISPKRSVSVNTNLSRAGEVIRPADTLGLDMCMREHGYLTVVTELIDTHW